MTGTFNLIAQAQAGGLGQNGMMVVMMVGLLLFMYLFVVRPNNKKKKEMQNMLNTLKKGDKVSTIGGIHGKVVTVKEDTITIRVDDSAEITFEKNSISRVISQKNTKQESKKDKKVN